MNYEKKTNHYICIYSDCLNYIADFDLLYKIVIFQYV